MKRPYILKSLTLIFRTKFHSAPVEFRYLTAECTRCSWPVWVSADLLPSAVGIVVLQVCEYRGADFDELLATVVRHNLGIGKEHKVKDRKPQRFYISCSLGDECAFRVNAALSDGVGLRVVKFQQQNSVGGSVWKGYRDT